MEVIMRRTEFAPLLATRLARDPRLAARLAHFYERLRALPRGRRRWFGRRARLSLGAAALLLALSRAPVAPPVYAEPTTTIEVANGIVLIAADGQCSLFEAVNNANDTNDGMGNKPGHNDCPAGNPAGADTIVLPDAGSFSVTTASDNTYYYTALPLIKTTITVEGNGSTITIGGTDPMRLFTVYYNETTAADLTLNDLTITGGNVGFSGGAVYAYNASLTFNHCTITGNSAEFSGGAVYAYKGSLTINNSTITGNNAELGGGIATYGTAVVITDSNINDNTSDYSGGGVYIDGGTASISNSVISGNEADPDSAGGGLYVLNSTLTMDHVTIEDNSAYLGAGIGFEHVEGTISNSAIHNIQRLERLVLPVSIGTVSMAKSTCLKHFHISYSIFHIT